MRWQTSAHAIGVVWAPPVVLTVVAGHELLYNHAGTASWVLAMTPVWLLVLRRRWPEPVLALTLVLALLAWRADSLPIADLSVLVALHAVAVRRPRRTALMAAAVVEVAAAVAAFRFAPTGSVNDAVVLLTGLVMSALLLGTTQHTQRQYLQVLEDRATRLEREQAQQAELAAVGERTRIARDIHDVVAHSVSVMIALSEGAAATRDEAQSRATMRQVAGTGRQALSELRRVVSVLREQGPEGRTPHPTVAALVQLADNVRAAGLAVTLDIDPASAELPDALQGTVYRIVQESLTNTLKHAVRATGSRVHVAVRPDDVLVEVHDDGQGAPARRGHAGAGVAGMTERAALYDGILTSGPTGVGWTVRGTLSRTSAGYP